MTVWVAALADELRDTRARRLVAQRHCTHLVDGERHCQEPAVCVVRSTCFGYRAALCAEHLGRGLAVDGWVMEWAK